MNRAYSLSVGGVVAVKIILSVLCLLCGAGLFLEPALVASAVYEGARLSFDVLLPSLFPMMALSGFICLSDIGELLALPLLPITRLLRIDRSLSGCLLASITGGYPTGALTLTALVEQKKLSTQDASILLRMLINAGPGFAVMAVGRGMTGSLAIGYILLISQVASTLVIGWFGVRVHGVKAASQSKLGYGDALVAGVSSAAAAMLSICSYVILFSVVTALAEHTFTGSIVAPLLGAMLEVTQGCRYACSLQNSFSLPLCAFILGFGGISVLFQIRSLCDRAGISTKGIFLNRLVAGGLTSLFCSLLLRLFGDSVVVFNSTVPPLAVYSANRLLSVLCISAMFLLLLARSEQFYKQA